MATPKKVATKRAPRNAKQIHNDRVTQKAVEQAELDAAATATSAEEWKASRRGRLLKLPSGYTAEVRNPGLSVFIEQGMIPNSLMPIVMAALDEGKAPSQRMMKEMARDMSAIQEMAGLARAVTQYCVIMPRIQKLPYFTNEHLEQSLCKPEDVGTLIPEGHELRDPKLLYQDEVDIDDCMFIFHWVVGGTHDLETFREEQGPLVADISERESVE